MHKWPPGPLSVHAMQQKGGDWTIGRLGVSDHKPTLCLPCAKMRTVHIFVCMYIYICVKAKGQPWVLFLGSHIPYFYRAESLTEILGLPIRLTRFCFCSCSFFCRWVGSYTDPKFVQALYWLNSTPDAQYDSHLNSISIAQTWIGSNSICLSQIGNRDTGI